MAVRCMGTVWLQCKLTGKAQEACTSLSAEDGFCYDKVKSAILQAYELVPEAYQQRFRNLRKMPNQSFIDFAREKGILFDRWCAACKIDDFSSLCELILIEEFKNCVPEQTALYLNEQKTETLQQAATFAEFTLTHTFPVVKREMSRRESVQRLDPQTRPFGSKPEKQCFFCNKNGHLIVRCGINSNRNPILRSQR